MASTQRLGVIVFPAALAVAACAPGESASSASAAEPGVAAAPARVQDSTLGTVDLGEDVALQLIVAPTGNAVRYRVREQLAGFDFPNDAVGSTTQISGGIALDSAEVEKERAKASPPPAKALEPADAGELPPDQRVKL